MKGKCDPKIEDSLVAWQDYLDQAEKGYVLEGTADFVFPIRRKTRDLSFYERLEKELRLFPNLEILAYRAVKEGFTSISRPSQLGFKLPVLLENRPYLATVRHELLRLDAKFTVEFSVMSSGASSVVSSVTSSGSCSVLQFAKANYNEVVADLSLFESCLEIQDFLMKNRREVIGLLPRQVAHGQSTKLIGRENLLLRWFGFFLQRPVTWKDFFSYFRLADKSPEFRFYAPRCRVQNHGLSAFHGLLADQWASQLDFSDLTGTLIIENYETFYGLVSQSQNTLLLWGAGWRVAALRPLLQVLPLPIYYWGDIDKEGYEIFALLKRAWPALKPLFMDEATIKKYHHLVQKKQSPSGGSFREIYELQAAYDEVVRREIQIEQEQMDEVWPFSPDLT